MAISDPYGEISGELWQQRPSVRMGMGTKEVEMVAVRYAFENLSRNGLHRNIVGA